jgi:transposase
MASFAAPPRPGPNDWGPQWTKQSTIADLAQQYQVHPNQIYAWKKQLIEQAMRAFDPGASLDAEGRTERTIEELYAKIGQLTVERDFLSKRSGG